MRKASILKLAVGAAILVASSASAIAGGWGYGGGHGWGYGRGAGWGYGGGYGCGCGGCGCGGAVAVGYQQVTVYQPVTRYVASYATVPYEQSYVVEQGPFYRPAVTGYRTATFTYDPVRRHRYVHDYAVRRHYGWRHYDRAYKRRLPPIGYK